MSTSIVPKRTIFSINPETGEPYMAPDYAMNLAKAHVVKTAKNLLAYHGFSMDDLVQEIMMRMSAVEFDPTKSSAKTFFILCATCHLGNLHKVTFISNDRYKCQSDFVVYDNEGEALMATEFLGIDNVTPLSYLETSEFVLEQSLISSKKKKKKKKLSTKFNS